MEFTICDTAERKVIYERRQERNSVPVYYGAAGIVSVSPELLISRVTENSGQNFHHFSDPKFFIISTMFCERLI